MASVKFQHSHAEIFEVDVEIAKQSVTIKTILEDLGMDDEENDGPEPLPNVHAATLKKEDENKEKRINDSLVWDQEFLKIDQGALFELFLAANYLNIKGLLDVACQTVANMIKGKAPEEICKTFNIRNDFAKEDEAQICKEKQWCEEK
ncbi:S-phase kinase-associated protein 1-like [Octodon degus]|uniref:S-phase kinase-associated protein 1 n=1 Tax=Octodon degus TaxID=10160 RepID=A0A6P3VC13_OCTDE|nr:S-phase kinase-associated protein 1-like [Octodon degus]